MSSLSPLGLCRISTLQLLGLPRSYLGNWFTVFINAACSLGVPAWVIATMVFWLLSVHGSPETAAANANGDPLATARSMLGNATVELHELEGLVRQRWDEDLWRRLLNGVIAILGPLGPQTILKLWTIFIETPTVSPQQAVKTLQPGWAPP